MAPSFLALWGGSPGGIAQGDETDAVGRGTRGVIMINNYDKREGVVENRGDITSSGGG